MSQKQDVLEQILNKQQAFATCLFKVRQITSVTFPKICYRTDFHQSI